MSPKTLSLELYHSVNSEGYYADLLLPATDAEITDAKHKLRCVFGEEPSADIISCTIVPMLADINTEGTLTEYNALAKRLSVLNSDELRVFRAVVARKMADEPEYVSVKNLINMTYELDSISIAQNIGNDEQLGALVIETGMNDTVLKLPDEALELLDKKIIGAIQRVNDNGFFYRDSYFALGDFPSKLIYDGVTLPDELMPDHAAFEISKDNTVISPIPYLDSIKITNPKHAVFLERIEAKWTEMNAGEQIAFKAALEAERPDNVRACMLLMYNMDKYEFCYHAPTPEAFAKEYLLKYLPENFDRKLLETANLCALGNALMDRTCARATEYGLISTEGGSIFNIEFTPTDLMHDTFEYDVIEVCDKKGLFLTQRIKTEEVPEGHYKYDLQYDEDGYICALKPFVYAEHAGTVITKEPIDLGDDGEIHFTEDTSPNFLGESMTVKEFAESDMSDLSDGMEMSL